MLTREVSWMAVSVVLGSALIAGCNAEAPGLEGEDTAPAAMESVAAAASAVEEPAMPATIADLFPEGDGKTLVLDNCSSCHAVACSTIGQRTSARWDNLKENHRDEVSGLGEEDLETMFAYLKANFSDSQPEPNVPPHFLEGGCTPF